MKYIALILMVFCFCVFSKAQTSGESKEKNKKEDFIVWTKEKAEKHLKNRSDPTKWDMRLFKTDLKEISSSPNSPINMRAFPVPKYDSLGKKSFGGLAVSDYYLRKVKNKMIFSHNYSAFKSPINAKYLGNKKSAMFFQIMVLTDYIDTAKYTHTYAQVISRNHPHYIGQGTIKTKNNKIEYVAFITADRNAYAIVNMRLFDLSLGKTILIAPQKDKSLRSMQIKSPLLALKEIDTYSDTLLKKKEVISFFTQEGTIG